VTGLVERAVARQVAPAELPPHVVDAHREPAGDEVLAIAPDRLGPSEVAAHQDYSTTTATDRTLGYVKVKARGTEMIMGSSRSRGVVTITARSSLFNQNTGGYSRWAGAKVTFQYRLTSTAAWRSVATVHANRTGLATKRIAAPTVRYWRAVLAEGAQVFGAASPQIRR